MSSPLEIVGRDKNGQLSPKLDDPRNYATNLINVAADEVQGDGAANGTLILSQEVDDGELFVLLNAHVVSKTANRTIYIVESDAAGVGGTETLLRVLFGQDIDIPEGNRPLAVIDNRSGTASAYCLVYAPQVSSGAAGNNAVTEWFAGSITGILE